MFHVWFSVALVLPMVPAGPSVSGTAVLRCVLPEKWCPRPASPVAFLPASKAFRLLFQPSVWAHHLLLGVPWHFWLCQSLAWRCCYVLLLSVSSVKLWAPWDQGLRLIHFCAPNTWRIDWKMWGGGRYIINIDCIHFPSLWSGAHDFLIPCHLFPVNRVLTELVSKMKDMQMDKSELGCLRAIVLFNPGDGVLLGPPPWPAPSALMFFDPLAQRRQRGERAGPGDLPVGSTESPPHGLCSLSHFEKCLKWAWSVHVGGQWGRWEMIEAWGSKRGGKKWSGSPGRDRN